MSKPVVKLPDSLLVAVEQLAGDDHDAINQFITSAVVEKVSALTTEKYIKERR